MQRLIPIKITNCGVNKYKIQVNNEKPYNVNCDEEQMRKAILRAKIKDGNGVDMKRSSKNDTYKNMIGKSCSVWKSKCPYTKKDFDKLLEQEETRFIEECIDQDFSDEKILWLLV